MPVTAANLTSGGDTTNQSVYTTASITPSANKLVLIAITSQRSTIDAEPGVTGCSLTWVSVAPSGQSTFDVVATPNRRITVLRAMGASPTTGTLEITFPSTQQGAAWTVDEFDGINTGGTNGSAAVRQPTANAADAVDTTTGLVVTLGAFADAGNGTYGAFGKDTVGADTWSPGAGFAELAENGFGTPATRICSIWKNSNDTTVDAIPTATSDAGGIALELVAAPVSGDLRHQVYTLEY